MSNNPLLDFAEFAKFPDYSKIQQDAQNQQLFQARLQEQELATQSKLAQLQAARRAQELIPVAMSDADALAELHALDPAAAKNIVDYQTSAIQRSGSYASSILAAPEDKRAKVYQEALSLARQDPLIDRKALADFPDEYNPALYPRLFAIQQTSRKLEDAIKAPQEQAELAYKVAQLGTERAQQQNLLAERNKFNMEATPGFEGAKQRYVEEAKLFGKSNVEYYNTLQDQATSATNSNDQLDNISMQLNDLGTTGDLTNARNAIANIANQLGAKVDTDKLASAEQFQQATGKLLLSQIKSSGLGGGQGFSNTDREFLAKLSPSLTNTRQGNEKIINAWKSYNQRVIKNAEMANQMKDMGITDRGTIQRAITQYNKANPIFGANSSSNKASPSVTNSRPTSDKSAVLAELRRRGLIK